MTRPVVGPIVKMPVEAQATDALRESIVTGAIAPGSRITEVNLAEQMNLSRATVRTALHQLAKEGLIILQPYTGWKVVALSAQDVWELYTLRSAVERLAGRLVAAKLAEGAGDRTTRALQRVFEDLADACGEGDKNAIAEADFAFHKAIITHAGHSRLANQYSLIEQQIRMYIRSSDELIDEPQQIIEQHQPILAAILRGDIEKAGQLSEAHNLGEGEKLSTHLAKFESPETTAPTIKKHSRR
ncbi:MAG TPA: GntR family transcriptional regulator [Rhizobiaceae bacterium]|nr:GntR family transcriptional regulator [Rhizobiaceae bacterium]